ncbi:hypothetical protein JYT92_00555 [bacterium AH-315-L15]|nr:hypothetical protein [bacterium AH-315-L15]
MQDPNHQLQPNALFRPEVRNLKIPRFELGPAFGIEVRRKIVARHSFLITISVWDGHTERNDVVPQITGVNVSDFEDVPRSSRYNLSLIQFWLGWRYVFFSPSPKNPFYLDIGLIGASFGQMTIDTLLKVPEFAAGGFPIVSSLEASGWGLTTRWGIGADYSVKPWLGFSFRAAYIFGRIPEMKVDRFFPSGFSTPPEPEAGVDLEPRPQAGDVVSIAEVARPSNDPNLESREGKRPLPLELDGFEVMLGIQFFF